MFHLSAIDPDFLTRFAFGLMAYYIIDIVRYWVSGLFTKGVFEKIQSYYGGLMFGLANQKIQELKRHAASTCTEIDDLLVSHPARLSEHLDRIINRSDLSPADQRIHRQLVSQNFKLEILLERLGVEPVDKPPRLE